ncbi:hypothetical protein HZB00_01595 [Candidatus Woesearchaeota archaeon]|nr:hypothetical protein [Candidatus Woesearchaeota archaeon]
MPHQCVNCNTIYEDGKNDILKGCTTCGGKFFFFVKKEHLEEAQKSIQQLSPFDKERMEKDVKDIIGDYAEDDKPVILDFASVNVMKPGKFELDLVRLFKGDPLVYKLEEGKYVVDVASTFVNLKKAKEEQK